MVSLPKPTSVEVPYDLKIKKQLVVFCRNVHVSQAHNNVAIIQIYKGKLKSHYNRTISLLSITGKILTRVVPNGLPNRMSTGCTLSVREPDKIIANIRLLFDGLTTRVFYNGKRSISNHE